MHGLESGGFRLCYYRNVIINSGISKEISVPQSPEQTNDVVSMSANVVEFAIEEEIFTVTCAADSFNDITTHGFLSLFILFLQELKFFELFGLLDPPEKEVFYTTTQKAQTIIASLAVGCSYNSDINHELLPYSTEANLLGMQHFPEQSQINRFLRHMDGQSLIQLDHVFALSTHYYSLAAMQDKVGLDIDSTGLIANGKTYKLNRKGYFAKRRGEKGYQLSLCTASPTRDILSSAFMPGNYSAVLDFIDLIYSAAEVLGSFEKIGLVRADAAYGTADNLDFLLDHDLQFVIKGRNYTSFKGVEAYIPINDWEYVNSTTYVYSLGERKIPGSKCNNSSQIIIIKHIRRNSEVSYSHLYTNLLLTASDVFELYNNRQCIESIIRTEKSYLKIRNLRTREYSGIAAFLQFAFMTHNLLNLFIKAVLEPMGITDIGIRNLVRKLMHVPAKVAKDVSGLKFNFPAGHYYTQQLMADDSRFV